MNKRMMLEYTTLVLKNVSFDSVLFSKELEKAVKTLLPYDLGQLMIWVNEFLKEQPNLRAELALLDSEIIEELAYA
ncbi:hypothetical protein HX057_08000 [Myroides odoratimimus]|uniref:hypothetical protein n=1 Tax=Myroides TaxID=76831 RepID=UPI00024604C6|nr:MULTISPECIES: hypothetical protein [Myroides]APA93997.1 hypothetical protein BK054_17590 [Myroides sp. ZB35]EHO07472.1 hypothetical protein HMPREF9714_02552 [Myroides odoratimimus CCUG 12901]EKB05462.1 hypothetical protein HMPREF9711_01272 [Myroides odoratimimus CCUG 3837]MDM1093948.1 hypothetical protein [Myroides odoratimimus]MDM1326564.1 hypothetical protein [Myroides odoratimimus]